MSKFKLYCIGTVMTDLISGNAPIDILPHELITNIDGDVGAKDKLADTVTASDGSVYNVNMNKGSVLTAIWHSNNSNRVTPPNVRKGEKVEVYQYGDSDKYYWKTMGSELDLRKLEHVKYVFVNVPGGGETQIEDSNSYSFTVSTLNKFIKIHTADNNGELTTYDFEIDTKEGIVKLIDGRGNKVELLSGTDTLTVKTNNILNLITDNEVNVTTDIINAVGTTSVNIKTGKANIVADTISIMSGKCSINP